MDAFIAGLLLLFLAVKLATGIAFVSTHLANKYLPKNHQARRFAPAIFVTALVIAGYIVADYSKISPWWVAVPLVATVGVIGWVLRNRAEEKAHEARQRQRLEYTQRATDIYHQYEANPHSLNDTNFRAEFRRYWDWSSIKADVIRSWQQGDKRCNGCGTLIRGKSIHVDHIKPRSKHPHLRYLKSNLQVLCDRCNRHKHDYDGDDWREVVKERKIAHAKRRRIQRKHNQQ